MVHVLYTIRNTLVDHLLWLLHLFPCGDSNLVLPTGFGLDIQQTYRSKLMTNKNNFIARSRLDKIVIHMCKIDGWEHTSRYGYGMTCVPVDE